ncbi:Signal transduction histidine kinase [Evansella caseinilytica]|uniref:histidine kinase n=1 Tax=Evansella caseinilytica TaxID=1503961 RepID=A0A1H3RHY7_9BACI|nr:HAMP domain-containing sensor histidine kinase [Evansella caseinilytica]SDZ25422.1 Signal transduction histidine kinase [Evansella caseinilytica]
MSSLKARMIWSYFLLIVLVVFVLGALFITHIWNYYYGSVQSAMWQRVKADIEMNDRIGFGLMTMRDKASFLVEEMASGPFHIQLLDFEGAVQIDKNGFGRNEQLATPDVKAAKNGDMTAWRGSDPLYDGERVIAVTVPQFDGQRVTSLLRYTASLRQVDEAVWQIIRWTLLIGVVVILLFLGLSSWMAQRIVRPIRELTASAQVMAEGNWEPCAVPGKDEIGQLAEAFNTLAVELAKRETMKNDFISSISHELRTPLTSIKGWSETLADSALSREELDTGLSIIHRETNRLSGLVEELLDFSQMYARRIVLDKERLDLCGLVEEVTRQLSVRQHETGVALFTEPLSGPVFVEGDVLRLKQVLINIIDNAYKFTPLGGTIRVGAMASDEQALLTVADTGYGIDPDDLPHVTEKFFKGKSGQTGSGIGLAICNEILELHGGELYVQSEQGKGTVVTMMLPLNKWKKAPVPTPDQG